MSNCRSCGKVIEWYKNENGNWEPLNPDGSSHFSTCPNANQFKEKHFQKNKEEYIESKESLNSKQTKLKC